MYAYGSQLHNIEKCVSIYRQSYLLQSCKPIDNMCKAMTGYIIRQNLKFGFSFQVLLLSLPALSTYYLVPEQRDSCIPLAGVITT